jgi:large subunit ribosomal protein L9e
LCSPLTGRSSEKKKDKMKTILAMETMDIPKAVTVKVAAKVVTVEGARGKLTHNFKHLNLDFQLQDGGRKLKVSSNMLLLVFT